MSREEVARQLEWSTSTLFRIETGRSRPQPGNVRTLLELYGVTGAERDGLTMTFRDRAYPLEAWVSALDEAGLLIERIREPAASDASLARFGPSDLRWRRLPMFLHLRAIKAQSSETS